MEQSKSTLIEHVLLGNDHIASDQLASESICVLRTLLKHLDAN